MFSGFSQPYLNQGGRLCPPQYYSPHHVKIRSGGPNLAYKIKTQSIFKLHPNSDLRSTQRIEYIGTKSKKEKSNTVTFSTAMAPPFLPTINRKAMSLISISLYWEGGIINGVGIMYAIPFHKHQLCLCSWYAQSYKLSEVL